MTKSNKFWALLIIILIVIIAVGSLIIWSKYRPSQPIEISLSPSQELQGKIYIGGAVTNPGFYSLKSGDTVDDIIQAAGGTTTEADFNHLKLYIPEVAKVEPPQKVNLNRAEAWLLQALPGIGEVRAQAIIDYRQQNGRFRNIDELIKVEGIGTATYERIEHLITVAD
ncbi:MAG: helix-hairpin-helix domain-containing protein [Dehalococcoidales bacterium]